MAERILCVLGNLCAGGVESIMFSYYRFLDKEKYQYDFLYEEGSQLDIPDDIIAMGARAYKVPPIKKPFKYMKAVAKIIKEGKYRIVHSNMNTLSVFSLLPAFVCRVKYRILHNHTTSSPVEKKRNMLKKLLRPFNVMLSNRHCACSDLAAEWMYGSRAFNKGDVCVFRNGVDTEKFAFSVEFRGEIRREFDLGNKKVIGHIGRFVTTKNHFFIIDIFEKYLSVDKEAVLMLVGDGELYDKIKEYAKSKGIADSIIFTGIRSDVHKLYCAFDFFILPSLYEGLPLVGIEACASGLPVLFADTITKEIAVTDAVSFLPIIDANVWAEKISQIEETDRYYVSRQMADGP